MPKITSFSNYLLFYSTKIYVYDPILTFEPLKCIDISEYLKNKPQQGYNVDVVQVSSCGQFLAATVKKELVLFEFPACEFISVAPIEKTACSVQFFHKLAVLLVADRGGSVTFFQYSRGGLKKNELILGHNSMLTDALVVKSDDFIITADRDEKIRVSCFPNVYNISTYCLGHENFVSSICIIPSDECLLLSASGDKTLRIWDYMNGVELLKYELDAGDKSGGIVKVICRVLDAETEVAVQKYNSADIQLLTFSKTENELALVRKDSITTTGNVLDITYCCNALLFLVEDQSNILQAWPGWESNIVQEISKALSVSTVVNALNSFDILFKRTFDEIQEYVERKKARIFKKSKALF